MHKDSYSMFCRYCGLLYRSVTRFKGHKKKCQFKECLRQDLSGKLYVRLWRRVAADAVWKRRMIEECHHEIINMFLLSEKSSKDLIKLVPLIRRFWTRQTRYFAQPRFQLNLNEYNKTTSFLNKWNDDYLFA